MRQGWIVLLAMVLACGSEKSKGEEMFGDGDFAGAVKYYTSKIEQSGSDLDAYYNRGRAYEEWGKSEEAQADFEFILSRDERHLMARLGLAKLAYNNGDFARASMLATDATKFHNGSAQAYFMLARSRHQMGYFPAAMEAYNAAISLRSNYPEAYLYRGALKLSMNDQSGCDDIRRAVKAGLGEAEDAVKKYCH